MNHLHEDDELEFCNCPRAWFIELLGELLGANEIVLMINCSKAWRQFRMWLRCTFNCPTKGLFKLIGELLDRNEAALMAYCSRAWSVLRLGCICVDCGDTKSRKKLDVGLLELRELGLYGVTEDFREPFIVITTMLKYSQASKLEFLMIGESESAEEFPESASSIIDFNFDEYFAKLLSALLNCTRLRCLEFALVTKLSVDTLNAFLHLVVRRSSLCELRLRFDRNIYEDWNLSWTIQTMVQRGKWSVVKSHGCALILRRHGVSRSPHLSTHAALVQDDAVNKYLGDHKYVKPRLQVQDDAVNNVTEESCIGIQNKYRVQIIALERINGFIEWFPRVTSCFEREDRVYYVPIGDVEADGFQHFQREVVRKKTDTLVKMNVVEITPKLNGWPMGAPEHLDNCVIGAQEHRTSNDQGALYLWNTFPGLAIHLILRPTGQEVKFPGPEQHLRTGDRLFMVAGICNDPQRRTGPLLKPEDVDKMMDPKKFNFHVNHMRNLSCIANYSDP